MNSGKIRRKDFTNENQINSNRNNSTKMWRTIKYLMNKDKERIEFSFSNVAQKSDKIESVLCK